MVCECGGAGYNTLTTKDLLMLYNIMHKQRNDVAKGTCLSLKAELKKRCINIPEADDQRYK